MFVPIIAVCETYTNSTFRQIYKVLNMLKDLQSSDRAVDSPEHKMALSKHEMFKCCSRTGV